MSSHAYDLEAARIEAAAKAKGKLRQMPAAWDDPLPLGEELPPVAAFDKSLLPEAFRDAAVDAAERMQVPLDFTGTAMVAGLSGAVGRRAEIQPKVLDHTWGEVPNLWGMIVASPGCKKTPAIQAALAPLNRLQGEASQRNREARAEAEGEQVRYKMQSDVYRQQYKAWLRDGKQGAEPEEPVEPPEPPSEPRLILNDATFEALHRIMAENPAGVFVLRDELSGWLSMLERSGREGERAFALEAWSGKQPHTIDRVGRGSTHAQACCMGLFGGIQPGRLRSYLGDALKDGPSNDGLIQRMQLAVWADIEPQPLIDRPPDDGAIAKVARVFSCLVQLPPHEGEPWRFSPAAQEMFTAWLADLEHRLRNPDESPAIVAHLAKYRGLMPSLALLFSLADRAASNALYERIVSVENAAQAIDWCVYLESHARRMYSCITTPEMRAARHLAEKVKRGQPKGGGFTVREVYRREWTGLKNAGEVRAACAILVDHNWLREAETGSDCYEVNPGVLA